VRRADSSARAQLAALGAAGGALGEWPSARGELSDDARHAAVLVLFGLLDGHPSDHEAQARAVSRDLDVLLLSRAETLSAHAGQVAFPGGRIDPDDDGPVAAALREASEETGLDPTGVEVLGTLTAQPLPVSSYLVTPVLGWWARPTPVSVIDPAESDDVFRVPVADLLDPASRVTTLIRRGGQTWRGPGFEVSAQGRSHLVWGFTGLILDGLFDRLVWTEDWDRGRVIEL
jgi:8-oxo-dGTP pyrophosphatase MutT (NUDIX family)